MLTGKLTSKIDEAVEGLDKEASILRTLHREVQATLKHLFRQDPGLKGRLEQAHGYAVFPSVGKAAAIVGAGIGQGEVFERGELIGYAGVVQISIGLQLGGDTFIEIIAFESKQALDRFKQGKLAFSATAGAVLIKATARGAADYEKGVMVLAYSKGGMLLEAAIGAQKFLFKPAFLGRMAKAPTKKKSPRLGGRGKQRSPLRGTNSLAGR